MDNFPTKAREIMKAGVVTLRVQDTLVRADLEMKFARIRHLPVVNEHDRVVGILSDRDLLRALAGSSQEAIPVPQVMTTRVYTLGPEEPAHRAADLMIQHKIDAVPVVGPDDRLLGVITSTDLLALASRALREPKRATEEILESGELLC